MKNLGTLRVYFALAFCFTFTQLAPHISVRAVQKIENKLLGNLSNGVYSFPGGKIRAKVPPLLEPGAKVRDEKTDDVTQVIFSDDAGAFYRVVLLDNSRGEYKPEDVMNVFKGLREKEITGTVRGRELRVIDLEKEGAEITIMKITKDKDGNSKPEQMVPDLLTANSVFEIDKNIIHVVAGVPIIHIVASMPGSKPDNLEKQTKIVKDRLEKLLSGIEPH